LIRYDCGPGNTLVDRFIQKRTKNKLSMDIDGTYGFKGKLDKHTLEKLYNRAIIKKDQSFFNIAPPKSLDVGDITLIKELDDLSLEDGCATLEAFTAYTIVDSLKFFTSTYPKRWILAGGGWQNPVIKNDLVKLLHEKFGYDIIIEIIEQAGFNGKATEAQLFAYLAVRHIKKLPTSYPQTTGVTIPIVGGDYYIAHGKI